MAAQTTLNRLTNNRTRNSYKKHLRAYLITRKTSTWSTKTMTQHLKSSTSKRKSPRSCTTMNMTMTASPTAKTLKKITIMINTTMRVKILYSTTIKKTEVTASKTIISKIGTTREPRKSIINNQNLKSVIYATTRQ